MSATLQIPQHRGIPKTLANDTHLDSWLKGHRNIHYCVSSEVCVKYHDDPLAADGATARWIPSMTKFWTTLQFQLWCGSDQSDIDIYIIECPLNYVPTPMTFARICMEFCHAEFPHRQNKGRNKRRHSEAEILRGSGQSDIEIYIIECPLICVPTPVTFPCTCMEFHHAEFPQRRNKGRTQRRRYRYSCKAVLVKVTSKYT
jgi:hypothetical protein